MGSGCDGALDGAPLLPCRPAPCHPLAVHVLLLSLAAVTLGLHVSALLDAWRGNRRMRHLSELPGEGDPPSVSVVIAAQWRGHVEWRGARYPLSELRAMWGPGRA